MEINAKDMHEHGCLHSVNEIFVLFQVSSSKQNFDFKYYLTEGIKSILTPSRKTISFFYLVVFN